MIWTLLVVPLVLMVMGFPIYLVLLTGATVTMVLTMNVPLLAVQQYQGCLFRLPHHMPGRFYSCASYRRTSQTTQMYDYAARPRACRVSGNCFPDSG